VNIQNESLYILVEWPDSQEFMDAPGAFLVENPDIAGASAYMVPIAVYDNYIVPPPDISDDDDCDYDDDYDDSMCGDHESALASVGWGSEP